MLNGTSAVASARCSAEESEVLEVPAAALRKALAELPGLGETIINAFIMRRERLERDGEFTGLRVVAPANSGTAGSSMISSTRTAFRTG